MKMIRAIFRLEKEPEVVKKLEEAGFPAFTRIEVLGRGQQGGVQVGSVTYEELAKTMLMIVAEDEEVEKIKEAILESAWTGNFGDGKIFVTPVEDTVTIRLARETSSETG